MNPLLVAAIAFGASLLAAVSGGSASLITTPAWVALGAPFPTAVAADKIAGAFWTLAAARTYLTRATMERRLLLLMGGVGMAAAVTGALVATLVDERILRPAAGVLILGAVGLSIRRPGAGAAAEPRSLATPVALAAPLGLYEGVLGSGNGILTTVMLQRLRGMDLLTALGHYYILASGWCGLAALTYLGRGVMDGRLALAATTGSVCGGVLGARLARTAGVAVVRPLFIAVGVFLAVRLIVGG